MFLFRINFSLSLIGFWLILQSTLVTGQIDIIYSKLGQKTVCNTTLYQKWLKDTYLGILADDPKFWIYVAQKDSFPLTNNMALQLAWGNCKNYFRRLNVFLAGRNGPIDIQHSYKAMCSQYCLESDYLHQQAMYYSGCSCLDLSTQPGDPSFTYPGDWCKHNSARMLCDMTDYCGVWDCRVDDFMCPRFEWNKKYIPLKWWGKCRVKSNAFKRFQLPFSNFQISSFFSASSNIIPSRLFDLFPFLLLLSIFPALLMNFGL